MPAYFNITGVKESEVKRWSGQTSQFQYHCWITAHVYLLLHVTKWQAGSYGWQQWP